MTIEVRTRGETHSRHGEQTWVTPLLLLLLACAFLIANAGAYRSYFSDDDLDNLMNNRYASGREFIEWLLRPQVAPYNFRPVGAYYYRVLEHFYGLWFPPFIAVLHLLHLLAVGLLWRFLRREGLTRWASFCGCLFFAFHLAAFQAYWRPMYVFDVLCGLFCLLALVLYQHGRTLPALLAFWLAYKSKELAVMLPVALLAYEYLLASRRWRRLIPFFAISLLFGVQALLGNRVNDTDYALKFGPVDLMRSTLFYARALFGISFAGLALLAVPLVFRARLALMGVATFCALLATMLLLPNRLNEVYLYAPLLGAAMAVAALAQRFRWAVTAAFVLWLPWTALQYGTFRRGQRAEANENRTYVRALFQHYDGNTRPKAVVVDGSPARLQKWGVYGVIRYLTDDPSMPIYSMSDPQAQTVLGKTGTDILVWNAQARRLLPVVDQRISYLRMGMQGPGRMLGSGWYPLDGSYRWTSPEATLHLWQNGAQFQVTTNVVVEQLRAAGVVRVDLVVDGQDFGAQEVRQLGTSTLTWKVSPSEGVRTVLLKVTPPFRPRNGDPRLLGIAVISAGFRP